MNVLFFCLQTSSAGHQNQHTIHGLSSSSTSVLAPLQYFQPGQSYPAAPYTGQNCATAPAPASLCSITGHSANYAPANMQQSTGSILPSAVPQNITQNYQSPSHHPQHPTAASSLNFPLKAQQTCQNCAMPTQQQTISVPDQQHTAAGSPAVPTQSYPVGSVVPCITTKAQCLPAQVPSVLQQVQGTVSLSSQHSGQSPSTPALYNQQMPFQQENQQTLLQNSQSNVQLPQNVGQGYSKPQQQHNQEMQHNLVQQMLQLTTNQQQVQTPLSLIQRQKPIQGTIQQESLGTYQPTAQQTITPASQALPITSPVNVAAAHQSFPAAVLHDAGSQSYAHSAFNILQQSSSITQNQCLSAQSTTPQTYGEVNQVGFFRTFLPCFFYHSQNVVCGNDKMHCSNMLNLVPQGHDSN